MKKIKNTMNITRKLIYRFALIILLLQAFAVRAQISIDLMAFNIWQEGTSVPNGLIKIRDVIVEVNPDIVGFSEVRNYNNEDWTTKIIDELSAVGLNYERGFIGGDVSVISKFPITSSALVYDQNGSIARFDIDLNGITIVVACAHLDYMYYACYLPRGYNGGYPNWEMIDDGTGNPDPVTDTAYILSYNLSSQRDEQVNAFLNSIENETNPVILLGDFNEPSHQDWTENTTSMFDHNGVVLPWQNILLLADNGFTDAYRSYFPDETTNPGISWPSYAHGVGSTSWTPLADERDRIDYIFYKGSGIQTTYVALVGPKESYVYNQPDTSFTSNENFIAENLPWPSDHKAVFATLNITLLGDNSNNFSQDGFLVYPNPMNDQLMIDLIDICKDIQIEMFDTKGKKVYNSSYKNKRSININSTDFESGIYILLIIADNNKDELKILVE